MLDSPEDQVKCSSAQRGSRSHGPHFVNAAFSLLIGFTGKAGVAAIWGDSLWPAPCSPLSPASLRHQQSPSEALLSPAVPSPAPPCCCLSSGTLTDSQQQLLCLAPLISGLGEGPSPTLPLERGAGQPLAMARQENGPVTVGWSRRAPVRAVAGAIAGEHTVLALARGWMCDVLGWTGPRPDSRGITPAAVPLPSSLPGAGVQRSTPRTKTRISEFPNPTRCSHTTRTTEVVSALQRF